MLKQKPLLLLSFKINNDDIYSLVKIFMIWWEQALSDILFLERLAESITYK